SGAVAIGIGNKAVQDASGSNSGNMIAVGIGNTIENGSGTIFGVGNSISKDSSNAVALGDSNSVVTAGYGSTAVGIGNGVIRGYGTTAVGYFNQVEATSIGIGYSSAFGISNSVIGDDSTAIGAENRVTGDRGFAAGYNARAVTEAVAIGSRAQATGETGIAIGKGARARESGATALGADAQVYVANGVSLGSGSVADTDAGTVSGVVGYDPRGMANAGSGPTWVSTLGAVSVGGNGQTRQITNVAAGAQDTDAVNVAQLKAAQDASTTHYYSVNDGGTTGGNYANDGAKGQNSIAAGVNASTQPTALNGIAIGNGAQTTWFNGIAIGTGAEAEKTGNIAIGEGAGTGAGTVVGSNGATSAPYENVALGFKAGQDVTGFQNVASG
ncbi:MAG: hypothetical protein EOO27_46500, partial [Comamonadaceae bacterium]